jgi:hypothetical protein
MPAARPGPKALLSLCREVDDLSGKIRDFSPLGLRHLDVRRRRAIRKLRSALQGSKRDPFRDGLRKLRLEHGLRETEILILLLLFDRRVRRADHATSGRAVLEAITRSGGHVLETARFLHLDAPLVRGGLVTTDAAQAEDVLDGDVRISDGAFRRLYRAFHGLREDAAEGESALPYSSAVDHLLDLRQLCDLARRRAGRLFPLSSWAEWTAGEERDAEELAARHAALRERITRRERATPEGIRLPVVHLRAQFGLSEEEEEIVVTLLLHELFASRTTIELTELARLVAVSDEDVVARRALVAPEGRLRSFGLLEVEEEPVGKDTFATAWLPQSVTERLLGNLDPKGAIGSDERASFRQYLEGLRGSDDFYKRL